MDQYGCNLSTCKCDETKRLIGADFIFFELNQRSTVISDDLSQQAAVSAALFSKLGLQKAQKWPKI